MNLTLWIVAGVLCLAYLFSGASKLFIPRQRLVALSTGARWAEDFSPATVKTIGVLEILAAVGLVLPGALGIAPVLTPLAACGLVMIMVGAAITRFRRREFTFMLADLAYLAASAFVAWGRFGPEPFTS